MCVLDFWCLAVPPKCSSVRVSVAETWQCHQCVCAEIFSPSPSRPPHSPPPLLRNPAPTAPLAAPSAHLRPQPLPPRRRANERVNQALTLCYSDMPGWMWIKFETMGVRWKALFLLVFPPAYPNWRTNWICRPGSRSLLSIFLYWSALLSFGLVIPTETWLQETSLELLIPSRELFSTTTAQRPRWAFCVCMYMFIPL